MGARTSSGRRAAPALLTVAAVGLTAAVGYVVLDPDSLPFTSAPDRCSATVEGRTVDLSVEQAENAALIAGTAVRRGLPARAVSIALATAYQESKLVNVGHGDRDSLGLFQQRPSQGWGTEAQVQDPVFATNAFYDALVEVDDYRGMEITDAAQEVQRSAFPAAYADHEADARVLASALTGNSAAAFACEVDGDADEADAALGDNGLTARAEEVRRDVVAVFGEQALGGFAPGGVRDGHIPGSAHYDGRAVDVFFRPVNETNQARGWAVAQYLVAQAERLHVATVIFDGRIWVAGKDDSWRPYDAPDRPGDRAILEHRDHVHVDVLA